MSSVRSEIFQEFFRSFTGDQLGLLQSGEMMHESSMMYDPIPEVPKTISRSVMIELARNLEQLAKSTGIAGAIDLRYEDAPRGAIEIEIADRVLFEPGSSELMPESSAILDRIKIFLGVVLSLSNRRVTVEGHTDSTMPRHEAFVLSARRAIVVLNHLLAPGDDDSLLLPPERFTVVGYGYTRLKAIGDSPEDHAKNRRVRIYLHPPDVSIFGVESK